MSETHTMRLSDYSLVGRDSKLAVETGETTPAEVMENRDVAASNKTIDP